MPIACCVACDFCCRKLGMLRNSLCTLMFMIRLAKGMTQDVGSKSIRTLSSGANGATCSAQFG